MPTIRNPILRGFNPDPSIVRVGDDYSTCSGSLIPVASGLPA
jgi:beta-xylosidase